MSQVEKMAASAVTALLTFGVSLCVEEIKFLRSVEDKVRSLEFELRLMRADLKEADSKLNTARHVQVLEASVLALEAKVLEARDAALNAEDLSEEFHCKIENIRRRGFFGKLRDNTSVVKGKRLHRIGSEAIKIRERIMRTSAELKQKIDGIVGQPQRVLRDPIANVNDGVVVNFKREVRRLKRLLLRKEVEWMLVIRIDGIPGVGKSTLARKFYDLPSVKGSYDHRAWVCVPRHCDRVYLLQRTLVAVTSPSNEELNSIQELKHPNSLERKLRDFLINKKFLVVLVGMWSITDWYHLKPAFPASVKKGSVVMLTFHEPNAPFGDHSCSLKGLSTKHSLHLLLRKTFPPETQISQELMNFLGEVTKKCKGHPGAVVELGNQLAGNTDLDDWKSVDDKIPLCWNPSLAAKQILESSYYNLPFHLKPCFLYLALFPEYCDISTKKLIRLWIAEGFVEEDQNYSMEEMAEEHLRQLIETYPMVDRGQTSSTTKGFKTIKMGIHKYWGLAISMALAESFSRIIYPQAVEPESGTRIRPRRYAVHPATNIANGLVPLLESNPSLRSLFVSPGVPINELKESTFKNRRMLRVLDLEKISLEGGKFPDKFKKSIHLRYLGLRKVELTKLPKSICKLRNLLTLDLRYCTIGKITKTTWSMKKMRHLVFWHCEAKGKLRVDINTSEIETLKIDSRYFANVSDILKKDGGISGMNNLRSLGIMGLTESQMNDLRTFLDTKSQKIQSLTLRSLEIEDFFVQSLPQFGEFHALTKLFLDGTLPTMLNHSSLPPNLTKLTLTNSRMQHDPMKELRKLCKLKILRLQENAYTGSRMDFSEGDLPKLELLQLCVSNSLEVWEVDRGALRSIETLHIENMRRLTKYPRGLLVRATLKSLEISGMTKDFEDSLQVETRHIASVKFHNTLNRTQLEE